MTKIGKELGVVQGQVDFHCEKMEYLENQGHRNNIRIYRNPEEPGETLLLNVVTLISQNLIT